MNYYIVVKYKDDIMGVFETFDAAFRYCQNHPNIRMKDYDMKVILKHE